MAAIDPLAALARVEKLPELRARKLLEILFSEWSQSDLKAAVEHVSKWSTYRKHFAFEIILLSRSDLEGSQKHSIARQLGIEHTAESIIAMALRAVPITDAADAWHSFYMANANGISTLSNEDRRLMRQSPRNSSMSLVLGHSTLSMSLLEITETRCGSCR